MRRKREPALALLTKRLSEPGLLLAQKADITLIALQLADRPGPETRACEEALAAAIQANSPARQLIAWKEHLTRDVDLLEPDTTAQLILLTLRKETDVAKLGKLTLALARVASRLEPSKAAEVCGEALDRVADVPFGDPSAESHWPLARAVAALAARMPRGEAIRSLADALGRIPDSKARQRLAAGLGLVITVMSPDAVAEVPPDVARKLADAFGRERRRGHAGRPGVRPGKTG